PVVSHGSPSLLSSLLSPLCSYSHAHHRDLHSFPTRRSSDLSFTIVVNDRPVLAKGANWIPDDCFPVRLTAEDYRAGVADALEAGMNTLRIWGGGLYESELLYELCDEAGIMVWQDFTTACAAYSELEPLRSEFE